jgi:hypothetical protein
MLHEENQQQTCQPSAKLAVYPQIIESLKPSQQ